MNTINKEPIVFSRVYRSHVWAVGLIGVLNLLDILTTVLALRAGGLEGNPIANFLLETGLLWPSKVFIPALAIVLVVFEKDINEARWLHRGPVVVAAHFGVYVPLHMKGVSQPIYTPLHMVRPPVHRITRSEPSYFLVHNLAWFVAGVYSLVVVMNTLTYISLTSGP